MTNSSRQCPICDSPLPSVSAGRVCDTPHCRVSYRRHLEFGGRTCLVCGRPLPASGMDSRGGEICGHSQCQVQYLRQQDLPADRRCAVCRVPLPPHRIAAAVCDDRECLAINAQRRLAEADRREKERIQRLRKGGDERKRRESVQSGVDDPDAFQVAVVPHITAPLRPRDDERVGRMRARLESIVEWAFTHPQSEDEPHRRPGWDSAGDSAPSIYHPEDIAPEATAVESPLFSAGCRLCRGYCCKTGGEHAYLNIGLIRGFISDRPELSAEQVVEEYLSRVPEISIENSCVFHGEFGCALPREMRSDMCNRWLCPGLKQIRLLLTGGAPPQFFIVSADEEAASDEIAAAEFITDHGPVVRKS